MIVLYCYTRVWDEAVRALPAGAELADVSRRFTAYWEQITARWGADDLMLVEQDIVIRPDVTRQFTGCPEPWCLFPYWSGSRTDRGLGCTRFRREIQLAVSPGQIQQESRGSCWECAGDGGEIPGCWRHLDGKICCSLTLRGFSPCVHDPPVKHLTYPHFNPRQI